MENYLSRLDQDEKKVLCEIISGKCFKEDFIRHPDLFQKIKPGFRAQKISEDDALKLAISNIDKPVLEMTINDIVGKFLKLINDDIEKSISEHNKIKVPDDDIAIIYSLLASPFENNIDIYLKLNEKFDEEHYKSLCQLAEDIKAGHEKKEKIKNLENENSELQTKIKNITEENEQKTNDINTLKTSLSEAQNEIAKLKAESAAINNTDLLSQFDDTNASLLPSAEDDQIVSLCETESDPSGVMLIRHADLKHDGQYHIFQKDEYLLSDNTNRRKIYYKNGPSLNGFVGVWSWSVQPNLNDPTKAYVTSDYCEALDAIEVHTISEASDLDGLAAILKDGILYRPHSNKIIFAVAARGKYTGILCDKTKLVMINDKTTIASDCIEVPVYKFTSADILSLNNGLSFYKKAFAGLPDEIYKLKSNLEIVKDIVVKSFSWPVYKTRGTTRSDWQAMKDLLETISVEDTVSDIEKTCHCSADAASKLLNEFKNSALQYINGETITDDILRSVVSVSAELREKTKEALRADWEKENQEELDKLRQENVKAKQALDNARQEEKRISDRIAGKEKLAKDVETAVNERIKKARENAADFIAEMAFAGGQPVRAAIAEPAAPAADTPVPARPAAGTASPYQIFPASGDVHSLKAHHSWEEVLPTAAAELRNAGVAEKYSSGLAAFLCASYIEKQPVLLAGPNAIDITQAFSAAVTAHKYGTLYCDGSYSSQIIKEIGDDDEKIVLVNNLVSGSWMNRLPEILSRKNIFYIVTHPYAEDIQVEPKSLYGFMLPLFTDLFVDKKASGSYYGGYFADNFNSAISDAGQNEPEGIAQLGLTPLVRNRITKVVSTMHSIYPATTADDEFMFALFPVAYATLNISTIEELGKSAQISESLGNDLQSLISRSK